MRTMPPALLPLGVFTALTLLEPETILALATGVAVFATGARWMAQRKTTGSRFFSRLGEDPVASAQNVVPLFPVVGGREFEGAMARVEIVNFSALFDGPVDADLLKEVDLLFIEFAVLVERYGGIAQVAAGHETVAYFDAKKAPTPALAALGALRDLHEAGFRINERLWRDTGFAIALRSSLAQGRLILAPQGSRRGDAQIASGPPVIETARILSSIATGIEDRPAAGIPDKNKIYFMSSIADEARGAVLSIAGAAETRPETRGVEARQVFRYEGHRPLTEVLASPDRSVWPLARHYRSDAHVAVILRYLREASDSLDAEKFSGLLAFFKQYRMNRLPVEARAEYLALVDSLERKARAKADGSRYAIFLSSAVLAGRHLVPKASYDKEIQAMFKGLLRSADKRVVANVLDAFAFFDPANDDILFSHLLNHKNNRILASVLVKEAIRSLNKGIAKQIESMLESENPYFIASGVWAVGEIAEHYRKTDRVYFSSHVHLRHLIDRGLAMSGHENEMVARQARALSAKSRGDAATAGQSTDARKNAA